MITAAEQYRALVAKLEAINPSVPVSEGGYVPAAAQQDAPAEAPPAAPAEAPPAAAAPAAAAPDIQQQIMNAPTFNTAYAMAKKAGLKTFKYCRTYAVKDAVKQAGMPAKAPAGKVDYTGQQDPLGGDAQNPMSFAANSNVGA